MESDQESSTSGSLSDEQNDFDDESGSDLEEEENEEDQDKEEDEEEEDRDQDGEEFERNWSLKSINFTTKVSIQEQQNSIKPTLTKLYEREK
ncbi:unnamed protein product [Rotaria sp. Silwood1]|nr:unnamed protein product [Rotaria sp. Silwood1]CAF4860545.1 unnamed protein product [Rotaria sp. Silwood1]